MNKLVSQALKVLEDNILDYVTIQCTSLYDEATAKDAEEIAKALRNNTAATSLELSSNKIGDGIKALAAVLKHNTTLRYLGLSYNKIDYRNCDTVGKLIEHNQGLISLDLSGNELSNGIAGIAAVTSALKVNKTLKILHMEGAKVWPVDVRAIASMLKGNQSLEELSIGCASNDIKPISDESMALLATALEHNHTLRKLKISLCGISARGAALLVQGINKQQSITELDLAGNAIATQDFASFSQALSANHSLRKLKLCESSSDASNYLNGEETILLAQAASQNPNLMELRVKIRCGSNELKKSIAYYKECKNLAILKLYNDSPNLWDQSEKQKETIKLFTECDHKNIVSMYINANYNCGDSDLTKKNWQIAQEYIETLQTAPEELTRAQLVDIQERAPSIAAAGKESHLSKAAIEGLFSIAKSKADAEGVAFTLPGCMETPAPQNKIPVSFAPAAPAYIPETPPIDAASITCIDDVRAAIPTRKLEYPSVLSQLVREGRFEEIMQLEKNTGKRLTPQDYQLRDNYREPSIIEMLTQQGKLATLFSPDRWKGDIKSFLGIAALIPPEEFERQVGISAEVMAEQLSIFENQHHRKKFIRPANLGRST